MTISIDHVAIFVRDLEAMRTFYETYFGATSNEEYHNPRTGLRTYFLSFDGTSRLAYYPPRQAHRTRNRRHRMGAHRVLARLR